MNQTESGSKKVSLHHCLPQDRLNLMHPQAHPSTDLSTWRMWLWWSFVMYLRWWTNSRRSNTSDKRFGILKPTAAAMLTRNKLFKDSTYYQRRVRLRITCIANKLKEIRELRKPKLRMIIVWLIDRRFRVNYWHDSANFFCSMIDAVRHAQSTWDIFHWQIILWHKRMTHVLVLARPSATIVARVSHNLRSIRLTTRSQIPQCRLTSGPFSGSSSVRIRILWISKLLWSVWSWMWARMLQSQIGISHLHREKPKHIPPTYVNLS